MREGAVVLRHRTSLVIGDAPIKAAPAGLRQVEIGINDFPIAAGVMRGGPSRIVTSSRRRSGTAISVNNELMAGAITVSHERGEKGLKRTAVVVTLQQTFKFLTAQTVLCFFELDQA
jgi:hypothetical protein